MLQTLQFPLPMALLMSKMVTSAPQNETPRHVLNNESDLQPTNEDRPSHGEKLMAKANARVELKQICDDAIEGELLTFEESKLQFAIRHLLLLTAFTAIIVASFNRGGPTAAFFAFCVSLLVWGWIYTIGRERKHDQEIARRLREFNDRYDEADLEGLDVNTVWRLRNRE